MSEIEVAGLTVRYGDKTAVDDVSFSLPAGRIYGLLGRNGAGKTSLLAVLAGFRRASAGTVLIGGLPVFENRRVTREVALVRTAIELGDGDDRVHEALDVARALRPRWDDDYAGRLLDRFGVGQKAKLGRLSGGQQAAFAIVVGLAGRTPVTMFDETYLGLDAPFRQAFVDELLAEVTERPRTVILSTHLIEEMGSLFEQVLVIDHGRLVLHADAEQLRTPAGMQATFIELTEPTVAGGL
jgi:ABC-2 type transport system ATP-binding protein